MPDPVLELCRVPAEPTFWVFEDEPEQSLSRAMYGWREARLTVRTVRGGKMRNEQQLFDEFAAAFQFPLYFGENWAALDDCLTDLEWLPQGAGYVLTMTQPLRVLEEAPDALPVLVQSLVSACEDWRTPVTLGEWWDRPAVPFNVILAAPSGDVPQVRNRWSDAGAPIAVHPL